MFSQIISRRIALPARKPKMKRLHLRCLFAKETQLATVRHGHFLSKKVSYPNQVHSRRSLERYRGNRPLWGITKPVKIAEGSRSFTHFRWQPLNGGISFRKWYWLDPGCKFFSFLFEEAHIKRNMLLIFCNLIFVVYILPLHARNLCARNFCCKT